MQNLGLFGVYHESLINIILPWRKIFSLISFTLILPLISFIFLISKQLFDIQRGTFISSEWDMLLIFNLICFAFILLFSILSTSAVVYTVASIQTAGKASFVKVMSIVPKTSKRLMVTFFCIILDFLAYTFLQVLATWAITNLVGKYCGEGTLMVTYLAMILIYVIGLVHEIVVWKLASVVTLLEENLCGFEALAKSKELVKGNLGLSIFSFLSVNVPLFVIQILFLIVVLGKWDLEVMFLKLGNVATIGFGIMCFLASCHLLLIEHVLQTVLYFVCKCHHSENIDEDALLDFMEMSQGDSEVVLKDNNKHLWKVQDHV